MEYTYVVLAIVVCYFIYRKLTKPSLADLPGPAPESFWLGNLRELNQKQVGEADFRWQREIGNLVRVKGALGSDILWVADPKALQYILQTSGYNFPKLGERRALSWLHSGRGLVWADGETHKKQRKVMLPSFGAPEIKELFPVLLHSAEAITLKWKDMLLTAPQHSSVINIPNWISRAAMDAIGIAAFDYQFNALEEDSDVVRGYNDLLNVVFGFPSDGRLIAIDLARYIPLRAIEWLQAHLPGKRLDKARDSARLTTNVAKHLLKVKSNELVEGNGKRDVFSLLVKANHSEDEKTRMSKDEMIASMRTLLFAGHETTANSICWGILELARSPEVQAHLRNEARETERKFRARGGTAFAPSDLDQMPYLQAVVKEVLRMHPILFHNFRSAAKDDILPLSKPIKTKSGAMISAVPIPRGTRFVVSITAYNRNPDLWGKDAHVFRPERWLDGTVQKNVNVGVYSNLLTFSGGIRSCIGWRFAVYELQAFLLELTSNFQFDLTDDIKKLRREPCGVMLPILEGEPGTQLPLRVSLAARDD